MSAFRTRETKLDKPMSFANTAMIEEVLANYARTDGTLVQRNRVTVRGNLAFEETSTFPCGMDVMKRTFHNGPRQAHTYYLRTNDEISTNYVRISASDYRMYINAKGAA